MDRYDAKRRVALIVDEWGAWHDVEPGTNPGFLYQQNSLRDALVAGVTLNLFNRHAARVRMANIAQTINVLQAMVLTDKARLLLTPTYHVFALYTVHHDARLLPCEIETPDAVSGNARLPAVNVSASRDAESRIHLTCCNLDPQRAAQVSISFRGEVPRTVSGRLLTAAEMQAHNTFEEPDRVVPVDFGDFRWMAGQLETTLPPRSVVMLEIR